MTTLEPRPTLTSADLAHEYPPDLELQQVQILLRHGERTPVGARFTNTGLATHWPYCSAAKAMTDAVLHADDSWDTLRWKRTLEKFGNNDTPVVARGKNGERDAMCLMGQLTDRGRETTRALGDRARILYVDQLGFLPKTLDEDTLENLKLRATPITRALESVQQAFVGLYPASTRAAGLPIPTVVTREMPHETLFPNETGCPRFRELARKFAERTAELYNGGPELAYINKKIGKWMPADSPIVKVDSKPRLSGVMDHVNATLAHGKDTKLPNEFYDKKVRDDIDRICREEWFVGYQESNEYRKLGIGGLIGDVTQRMVENVTGHPANGEGEHGPIKMSLSGCHDTTIGATLVALGAMEVERDEWPRYTSSITFELFKGKNARSSSTNSTTSGVIWPSREKTWWYSLFSSPQPSSSSVSASLRSPLNEWSDDSKSQLDDYYVRLRYNDRPVSIPFCKPASRHFENDPSFCTLAAFKQAADSFTPKDWKTECNSNLGTPAMKNPIERPPGLS